MSNASEPHEPWNDDKGVMGSDRRTFKHCILNKHQLYLECIVKERLMGKRRRKLGR